MRTQDYLNLHNLCMLKGIFSLDAAHMATLLKLTQLQNISDLQISVLFYCFLTEAIVIGTHLNGMDEALFICTNIILSIMRFS